jgi:hypothetical protein
MTDDFERRLRASFQRADLPLAPDDLRAFLIAVPRLERARPTTAPMVDFLRMAAVFAAVAVVLGAMWVGYTSWLPALDPSPSPTPSPVISPSPSASPQPTPEPTAGTITLPGAADLLREHPTATLRLERGVGPADRPRSDDATEEDVELQQLTLTGDLLLAAACLGPGELTLEVRMPGLGGGDPFPALVSLCDGEPSVIRYQGFEGAWEIQLVAVHVARGTSWRLAVGELPAADGPAPSFEPIAGRPGWWPLWDGGEAFLVQPAPGTGVGPIIPDDVTTLGIYVQCSGDVATVSVTREEPGDVEPIETEIECSTGEPAYVEVAVVAGEKLNIWIKPTEPAFVRWVTEVDAMPVSTYGSPPELPADIAGVEFVHSNGTYVALGTLGGERQVLVPRRGVGPDNLADGGRAAVGVNGQQGARLELYDVSTGELLSVIAEHPAGQFIRQTWVDAEREQVFYTVFSQPAERLEVHRVAFDGTGQQLVINAGGTQERGGAGLVGDAFMFDACRPDLTCRRRLIDTATLEVTTYSFELDAEMCDVVGATDSHVVWRTGYSCQAFGVDNLLVMSFDSTDQRLMTDVGAGSLVNTSAGWSMLYSQAPQSDEYDLLDIETGASRSLGAMPAGFVRIRNVGLPQDWILLAPWYGLGDFPRSHMLLPVGQPPILLNVLSGEVIELVNLPH